MKKVLLIGLFLCLALIQLATPYAMIVKREGVLKEGALFKFQTQPVDPYDAFRGRYVALSIKESKVPIPHAHKLKTGQTVFAGIAVGEDGFARFSGIYVMRPSSGAYMQAKVSYIEKDGVNLILPVDRYYMEEKSAPRAEKIYWQHSRQDRQDAYISVRVKDGFAVIEGLYVGGKRIEEMAKNP